MIFLTFLASFYNERHQDDSPMLVFVHFISRTNSYSQKVHYVRIFLDIAR